MFHFVYPWLLLLLSIPLFFLFWEWRQERPQALAFPLFHSLKKLRRAQDRWWLLLPKGALYLSMVLFVLALARPQLVFQETEVTTEGVDIILAIDTSLSMGALDFNLAGQTVNRLTAVKKVVTDFIRKQQNDRIGMVVFGEQAYTQCPLTLDSDVLVQFLDHLQLGMAGDGTAIGDGLGLSVKRLKDVPGKSKVVILLTDGRNNSGRISPEKAAEIAKTFGIKVYTIGIGTQGLVPFPQPGIFGQRLIYVKLELDQETLENIANITDGRYFYAGDTEKLQEIYSEIGELEKTELKVKHYQRWTELYRYFLVPALCLLLLEVLLSVTVAKKLV